ncbi:MAG: hypothetical protein JEZ02_11400 [Desulfatibacillum sp.]|nr:hypothetical protein [Desulfatibacillum sp.]
MRDFIGRFVVPFSIPVVSLFFICWLFPHNAALALTSGALFFVTVAYRPSRFKFSLALYAILLGTLGEYLCCRSNLWVYKYPTAFNLPMWIPFIWPMLVINLWEVSTYILELLDKCPKALRVGLLVFWGAVILAYVAFTSFYLKNMIAWILLGFFLIVVAFSRKPINIWLFVAVAAGGFFGEYVCVQHDVWYYTRPVLKSIGMPLSLPMAWGVSGNIVWLLATALPVFGRDKAPG